MCTSTELKYFIQNYVKALKQGNAAIFAGAGLSAGAGYVDWKNLLKDLASEIDLNIDKEHDLVGLAQYYCNKKANNRGVLNQIILDEFKTKVKITENHKILSKLPIHTFWTTNYDTLIENSLEKMGKIADIKIDVANLATNLQNADATVYKMHGDVSQVQKAVITRDDYEKYSESHCLFTTTLKGDLLSKTFLFIGFSFSDPNLNYILSKVRIGLEGNQRPHYCILKKVSSSDYNNNKDFIHAKAKQNLQILDLQRYSINTILVDTYDKITEILGKIESEFKKNSIFISGSAYEYKEFCKDEAEAGNFLHDLSYRLIEKNNKIISGFGFGVGSYIINGALQYAEDNGFNDINRILLLRPFPQKASKEISLPNLWSKYRENMISNSGIAIFVFGNTLNKNNGKIENAGGLQKEFEIAKKNGVKIIPVGITGYQTKKIYTELINNFEQYYPDKVELKPLFENLSKVEYKDKLIKIIIEIISKI